MCNVSMVMDTWRPHIPYPNQWPTTAPLPAPQRIDRGPMVVHPTPEELRELLDAFRAAVKAAEVFDRLTGQPDCVDPEKAKLEERVADLERKLEGLGA